MFRHEIDPIYDKDSKVLILGSFPSVKSREEGFYYAHPRNRFWKILAAIYDENEAYSIKEKKDFLLSKNIALWDVISSCDINGSADSSIRNIKVNDICSLLEKTNIKKIFTNGSTAYKLYQKYLEDITGISAIPLPSTSPANASYSFERLLESWKMIKQ